MCDDILCQIQAQIKREIALRDQSQASPLPFSAAHDLHQSEKQQIIVPDFAWFIPNMLAALAYPRSADVFPVLRDIGISALLNLSEAPLPANSLEKVGLRTEHIPIVGFIAPGVRQIKQALTMIDACLEHSMPVGVVGIVHAGVILACYLVERGTSAHTAIGIIRQWRSSSLAYAMQEAAVLRYEAALT
jgi:atypical dual specificity phosphatase